MPTSHGRSGAGLSAALPHESVTAASRRRAIPGWSFVLLGGFTLVVSVLYIAQAVLMPIALAVLFTFFLAPIVSLLQRVGLGRVVSVIVVTLLALGVIGGLAWVVGTQVVSLAHELPQYRSNIREKIADVRWLGRDTSLQKVQETVKGAVDDVKRTEGTTPAPAPPAHVIVEEPGGNQMWRNLAALGEWMQPLGIAALVAVLVPFMLLERQEMRNRIIRLIGFSKLAVTTKALDEAGARVSRYLLMQTIVNTTFGAAVAVGLLVIGVPYALLFGFLAAVLRFIPYVGPWVAALFPVALSLAVFPGWTKPVIVVALFLVLELFSNMVMETLLYANTAGVSEVALLVAVAFWTWLWGPVGLILATPLTVCLVVFAKYVPDLRFVTVLMTAEEPLPAPAMYYHRLLAEDDDEAVAIVEEYVKTHPVETVYDELLVPALTLAARDRARGHLTVEEERIVMRATRAFLERFDESALAPAVRRDEAAAPVAGSAAGLRVFGCPARDDADEVALLMFRALCATTGAEVRVVSAAMLSSEVVSVVGEQPPDVVLVAGLAPGGLAQTRYLCKRLRAAFPALPVVVGRWCSDEDTQQVRNALMAAGATEVGF
ncbi:MAG TPA: AI-2E family transporter, partial [Candidatus Limnocylindria bacterium]|nr:AI-2E family transporter [Candidatus Limnocylindria bacterium]